MKRYIIFSVFLIICIATLICVSDTHGDNNFNSVVSVEWLQKNYNNPSVMILDIRKVQEFREAHIPDSVNLTYTAWRTMEKDLDCQLPPEDDLNDTVCSIGLQRYKHVVLIGSMDTDKDRVNTTRVAWTLKYASIQNPGILDGGFKVWASSRLPLVAGWETKEKGRQKCKWNKSVIATKEHVLKVMETAAIVDTRPEKIFSGKEPDPKLKRRGHIPHAVNLPYSLVFKKDGTFEEKTILQSLAYNKIGDNKDREVIVLCCNGQYASSWWFVLSEILGYKKVAIYDGSMEDWCKDDKPLIIE